MLLGSLGLSLKKSNENMMTKEQRTVEDVVLRYYNTTRTELFSKSRTKEATERRFVLYHMLYQSGLKEREIAAEYGVTRGLINHARKAIADWLVIDKQIKRTINELQCAIDERLRGDR